MDATYPSTAAHLRDELERLDLLLTRHLAQWTEHRGTGEPGGFYVTEAQVIRLLGTTPGQPDSFVDDEDVKRISTISTAETRESDETAVGELNQAIETLSNRIDDRETADSRLTQVCKRFALNRRERDALLLTLAPELDMKYEKIFAYLQDDYTRTRPTIGLLLRVIAGVDGGAFEERGLLDPDGTLRQHGLLSVSATDTSMLSAFVEVDRRICAYIIDGDSDTSSPGAAIERIDPASSKDWPSQGYRMNLSNGNTGRRSLSLLNHLPLSPAIREQLVDELATMETSDPTILSLSGPHGSARRAVVRLAGMTLDQPIISVNISGESEGVGDLLESGIREARLVDGILHIHQEKQTRPSSGSEHPYEGRNGQSSAADKRQNAASRDREMIDRIANTNRHIILTLPSSLQPSLWARVNTQRVRTLTFPILSSHARRSIWQDLELPDGANPDELGSKFRLTPGQIQNVMRSADALASHEITAEDVYRACRAHFHHRLGTLANRVEPTYGIDDIVLPSEDIEQLKAIIAQIEHRDHVYGQWGFQAARGGGSGINVLFSGPSGTGKTMAAQIIANETSLDLYRIDLASVVSKYIGETEKNLGRIFDEAANSSAIIFFDEADALFGERTEVSDAHDRYANIEINYLLQRMDDHDGIVLLATNFETSLDEAFERRLDRTIEFIRPDRDARIRLWQSSLPTAAPVGELDWDLLAGFDLTGGNIATITVNAAFAAASDDSPIEMRHVIPAVARELEKSGQLYAMEDFGAYAELLH